MSMNVQECSTAGCTNHAAFTTRTKPAWCTDCIDGLLREGGLEAAEPFPGPGKYRLTACLSCGVQAHYKLSYTLEKNALGEDTCRACYWKSWAANARSRPHMDFHRAMLDLLRVHSPERIYEAMPILEVREFLETEWWPVEKIVEHLDKTGHDFLATTVEVTDGYDPVVARCRSCGKISAARMGDFGGCSCFRNPRSSSSGGGGVSFADSDTPGLKWWDHERNTERTLREVTIRATRNCYWKCPECALRFEAKVYEMALRPSCPDCSAKKSAERHREYDRLKVMPISEVPELAEAWADDADPETVMVAGSGLRRFQCSKGHWPRASPLTYLRSGCAHCRGEQTKKAPHKRWLADVLPEIASQWHPTRNGNLTPQNVVWDSKRNVWWQADCCGHEWEETVRARDKYSRWRCPECRTILDSLAWSDPGLAAEWSPSNPKSAWQVRPYATTPFTPEWICATDPKHVWRAKLPARSNGAECPECRQAGKSSVELEHHAAAIEMFGEARSGAVVHDEAFTTRRSWTTDISVNVDGQTVVIEYDGAYWHAAPPKVLVDERKSADLLAAGFLVVRLREDDLPPLGVSHPRYREIRVYSRAARPRAVMETIRDWVGEVQSR